MLILNPLVVDQRKQARALCNSLAALFRVHRPLVLLWLALRIRRRKMVLRIIHSGRSVLLRTTLSSPADWASIDAMSNEPGPVLQGHCYWCCSLVCFHLDGQLGRSHVKCRRWLSLETEIVLTNSAGSDCCAFFTIA